MGKDHVRVMLVPSSSEIMTEKLPSFAAPFSQAAITNRLEEKGIGKMLVPVRAGPVRCQRATGALLPHGSPLDLLRSLYRYQAWAASLGLDSFKPSDFQQETRFRSLSRNHSLQAEYSGTADSIVLYRPKKNRSGASITTALTVRFPPSILWKR